MEELISIIIPVHNVEEYLKKCIDSIIDQTYKNFEIILIDDNSTDNSKEICLEYTKNNSNVFFYSTNNHSAGLTRNFGVDKAKGKYITFIDSDDYIHRDFLKILYEEIIKSNSDAVICGANLVFENGEPYKTDYESSYVYNEEQIIEKLIYKCIYDSKSNILYSVWGGLYSRDFILNNSILFNNENEVYSEDSIFNIEYFLLARKISIIEDLLYYHLLNNKKSICNDMNSLRINNINKWNDLVLNKTQNKCDTKEIENRIFLMDCSIVIFYIKDKSFISNFEENYKIFYEKYLNYFTKVSNNVAFKNLKKIDYAIFISMKYNLRGILKLLLKIKSLIKG